MSNKTFKKRILRTSIATALVFASVSVVYAGVPITPAHHKMLYLKTIVDEVTGRQATYGMLTMPTNFNGWQIMDIGAKQLSNGEIGEAIGRQAVPLPNVKKIVEDIAVYEEAYRDAESNLLKCGIWFDPHSGGGRRLWHWWARGEFVSRSTSRQCLDFAGSLPSGSRGRALKDDIAKLKMYMAQASLASRRIDPDLSEYLKYYGDNPDAMEMGKVLSFIGQKFYGSRSIMRTEEFNCNYGNQCTQREFGYGEDRAFPVKQAIARYLKTGGIGGLYGSLIQSARYDIQQKILFKGKTYSVVYPFKLSADENVRNSRDKTFGNFLGVRILDENGNPVTNGVLDYKNKLYLTYRDGFQFKEFYENPTNRAVLAQYDGENVPFESKRGTVEEGVLLSAQNVTPSGIKTDIRGAIHDMSVQKSYFLDTADAGSGNGAPFNKEEPSIMLNHDDEAGRPEETMKAEMNKGLPCLNGNCGTSGLSLASIMRVYKAGKASVDVTSRWYALPSSITATSRTLTYDGCSAPKYEQKTSVLFDLIRGHGVYDIEYNGGQLGKGIFQPGSFRGERVKLPVPVNIDIRQEHQYGDRIDGLNLEDFYRKNTIITFSGKKDDRGNPISYQIRKARETEPLNVRGRKGSLSFGCEDTFEASYKQFVKDNPGYTVGGFVKDAAGACRIAYKKTAGDTEIWYQVMPYADADRYVGSGVNFTNKAAACSEICPTGSNSVSFVGNCSFRFKNGKAYSY